MNKNARMWLIGIAAALIVILLIAGFMGGSDKEAGDASPSASQAQETSSSAPESASNDTETSLGSGEMSHDHSSHLTGGTDSLSRYLTEQDSIMMTMMEDMIIRERSGSAAVDFLKGMIPHHEAAVRMSESYLSHEGESEELKTLARNIITTQKEEIKQMNGMIKEYKENGPRDDANEDAYLEKYSEMFSDDSMSHHINPEGAESIDQAFAEGMIMHHQMAVDMAKDILDYTDQEDVRELAQNIIDLQEEEIAQMEQLVQ